MVNILYSCYAWGLGRCNIAVIRTAIVSQPMMSKLQEARQRLALTMGHQAHAKSLNQHTFFKLHDRGLSIDLVQETFTKTWSYLVKGGKIDVMKAFLYNVLNNLIVDEYRKRKIVSLDFLLEKGFEPRARESPDRVVSVIDSKEVLVLIQQLSVKYQKVIRMRYIQDLSFKEISLITGQTQNAIAVQIHRGFAKLKALYDLRYTQEPS